MIEIKNRFTNEIIAAGESYQEIFNSRANLSGADLSRANLSGADLSRANLSRANLSRADLSRANLSEANLSRANLSQANLSRADLSRANLSEANLSEAKLFRAILIGADLSRANLSGADLSRANLSRAKLFFVNFPSITMFSSFNLDELSDRLTVELMKRDAHAHPEPELFDIWKANGSCPYSSGVDYFWKFEYKRELWSPGLPEMTDRELILEICRFKGWKIKKYLE